MINVEKLQKEHFAHHDFVLPHYRGYPIRAISASCPWTEEHMQDSILNVAVSLPNEEGIEQLKHQLRTIGVEPGNNTTI